MVRAACCDKTGVKKGPWTPEEDIMLVSYVQQHGPANWRAVPSKTGLRRCSKSCRLRWTNYLRPGIKRGSFTHQEEKMIIQLQALLGNKWAAIASYLPERTDNDIKNYWNTHLKKKLKKQLQPACPDNVCSSPPASGSKFRGQWEMKLQTDINTAKQALHDALSLQNTTLSFCPSTYASSTENIARLLKNWTSDPTKPYQSKSTQNSSNDNNAFSDSTSSNNGLPSADLSQAFDSLFGLESLDDSTSDLCQSVSPEASQFYCESKTELSSKQVPLSMLEDWLLDEAAGSHGKEEGDFPISFPFNQHGNLF